AERRPCLLSNPSPRCFSIDRTDSRSASPPVSKKDAKSTIRVLSPARADGTFLSAWADWGFVGVDSLLVSAQASFYMAMKSDRAAWLKAGTVCCSIQPNVSKPRRLVLLGAPGVGKGTQAEL